MDVEVRCPNPPGKLFAKLVKTGDSADNGTLIEFACADCAKYLRRKGKEVFRTLHRYDFDGTLVETLITYWEDIVER